MKLSAILVASLLAAAVPASAKELTPLGDVERGTMVTVAGEVQRILDTDEFRLSDDTGSIKVYVGPNWAPVAVGDAVTVSGFVDSDFGRLELYARTLTQADGTVIQFEHRYD
jgi:uncharacterized protein YdeI (BOF family)